MKARRRLYEVGEVEVEGVKLPVLVLKKSEVIEVNLKKKDSTDALTAALMKDLIELEEKGLKDVYVEYVVTSGKLEVRVGGGKGLKGELSKWPAKLKRVAVLKENPKEVNLNSLKWYDISEETYVYEGKPRGQYKAILLDTEDGTYLILSDEALEAEVKEWEFEEEGAEKGEEDQRFGQRGPRG